MRIPLDESWTKRKRLEPIMRKVSCVADATPARNRQSDRRSPPARSAARGNRPVCAAPPKPAIVSSSSYDLEPVLMSSFSGPARGWSVAGRRFAAAVAVLLCICTSGVAYGSGEKEPTLRLLVTSSIVRPGREVTVRVIGSRGPCTVALIRSLHLVRVWRTTPPRAKLSFRSGRKSEVLTVSAKCGRQTRIAPVWVVSRHRGRTVQLGYEPRAGMDGGGPIVVSLARSGVAARAPRALGRAARDTGPLRGSARARAASAGVRSAIVAFAKSQIGLSSPAGSLCNPYSAYWHEGSGGCPNGWTSNWWCAEFAAWAWSKAGVSFPYGGPSDVNAFSASFYVWGSATGNWHPLSSGYQPQPGDVAVYGSLQEGVWPGHVGIVVGGSAGHPDVINGDWGYTTSAVVEDADEPNIGVSGGGLDGYVSPPNQPGGGNGPSAGGTGPGAGGTGPGGPPTTAGGWQAAFNAGSLWTIGRDDRGNLQLGIASGTTPSITYLTNGSWEAAWNAGGDLWVTGPTDVRGDMHLGMAPGTSPSITAMPNGGWEVAFQASNGHLWVIGSDDRGDMNLGMAPGTSPSITSLTNGSWEVAWNAGDLWITGPTDVRGDMKLGMASGTSPSITGLSNGSWEVAWNAGDLWITGPTDVRGDMKLGMASGTSPSITGLSNGSWEVAWNAGDLWITGPTDVRGDMKLGMASGTSPSITGLSNGSWEVAWNAGDLGITGPTDVRGDMHLGMASGTSPSIAP